MPQAFVLMAFAVLPDVALGSCGLDHCPAPQTATGTTTDSNPWSARGRTRWTSFDELESDGSYTEFLASGEYRGVSDLIVGATVPLVVLMEGADVTTGVGNSVVYAAWNRHIAKIPVGFGLQVELPWGVGEGIADDHWVLLPNATAHLPAGRAFAMLKAGLLHSLGGHQPDGHDHSHEAVVFVNPHSRTELRFQSDLGVALAEGIVHPMLTGAAQQPLVGDDRRLLVQVGVGARVALNQAMSLRVIGELPVSSIRRFERRVSVGVAFQQ